MSIWNINADKSGIADPAAHYMAEQAERTAWFNKIKPAGDWKLPIDCWIDANDLDDCSDAAVWFTGAPLEVIGTSFAKLHVTSPGYYAVIGA